MPVVGSTVGGKYRIERAIGAGGMGTVVQATHIELGAPVALKFLSEKIRDSASSRERFTREAKASAQLRSEHVCRVSDFGIEDGVPYIAMELLEGIDLARLLDSGPVAVDLAIEYILQACIGLAEAHGLGIVHRDLKPSNLFLARRSDGSPLVKVLDFGIAKIPTDGERALTQTAHVIGSPGYMAPEQLRSSRTVDSRADVWALGVILYELISSRHPFHASAVTEIAVKIAMDDPDPLPEAPPAVRDVIMRCLAKDPKQRYAEVGALAAALAPLAPRGSNAATIANRFLVDAMENRRTTIPRASVRAEAETKVERPETPKRSHAVAIALGIGSVLVAGAVVTWIVVTADRDPPPPIATIDTPAPIVEPPPPPTPKPTVTPDVTETGREPVRRTGKRVDPKPIETLGKTAAAVTGMLKEAAARMQAKGLLSEDVPGVGPLRDQIRAAVKAGSIAVAQQLAERLLAKILAIQVDKAFVEAKVARMHGRINATRLAATVKKQLDDLMTTAEGQLVAGEFVAANLTLSVIAGLIASATP